MSIRPVVIDRTGDRPCIPGFYQIAKRMAEGKPPTFRTRVVKCLGNLRRRLAR